jgi:hypothetical protein
MSYKKTLKTDNYTVIIYIDSEHTVNPINDWVDSEVILNSGERYYPSFFTIEKIKAIMSANKESGDDLNGLYFWAADLLIIEELSESKIMQVIEHLYKTGKLEFVLCHTKYKPEPDVGK